ncbi:hypothetical protein BD626DRAFT_587243 [Schizophyllum amplum]|uniref:Uncharacterized protein n=1 Tax=Schizophyllum amplum TaxID=97359 RepID=A0A550BVM1_9AGAR|nr:hypothetical protein BD626DRAFT_587243 [Auriculariopsis ampla]
MIPLSVPISIDDLRRFHSSDMDQRGFTHERCPYINKTSMQELMSFNRLVKARYLAIMNDDSVRRQVSLDLLNNTKIRDIVNNDSATWMTRDTGASRPRSGCAPSSPSAATANIAPSWRRETASTHGTPTSPTRARSAVVENSSWRSPTRAGVGPGMSSIKPTEKPRARSVRSAFKGVLSFRKSSKEEQ